MPISKEELEKYGTPVPENGGKHSNGYGLCAVKCVDLLRTPRRGVYPATIWNDTIPEFFPNSRNSQEKGCPRTSFLALCSSGYIPGIPDGFYTEQTENWIHAIKGVQLLQKDPDLANDIPELWRRVTNNDGTSHDSQMNVVVALWKAGYILKE